MVENLLQSVSRTSSRAGIEPPKLLPESSASEGHQITSIDTLTEFGVAVDEIDPLTPLRCCRVN